MTRVINIRSAMDYDIYIGRPGKGQEGKLGNPIIIGRKCGCGEWHRDGGSTLPCYRKYLARRIANEPAFAELVKSCHNKTLACFCVKGVWTYSPEISPSTYICHGQVLAQVAAEAHQMDTVLAKIKLETMELPKPSKEWLEYWAKKEQEFEEETGVDPFSQEHWDAKLKQSLREKQGHLCTICHINPVAAEQGFDTCESCLKKM